MASPSISEICRPESFALINTSNNCWMMKRLCLISTSFTNRENPLMSGIKSKPLFSISFFLQLATNQVYTEGLPALQSAINYSIFHIPPDFVVDPWTSDGESASHRHSLFRQGVRMVFRRQISEDIT